MAVIPNTPPTTAIDAGRLFFTALAHDEVDTLHGLIAPELAAAPHLLERLLHLATLVLNGDEWRWNAETTPHSPGAVTAYLTRGEDCWVFLFRHHAGHGWRVVDAYPVARFDDAPEETS